MQQAITTAYICPTDTEGSKIKAFGLTNSSLLIPYPHELSGIVAHQKASDALAKILGCENLIASSSLPRENGYVFIYE